MTKWVRLSAFTSLPKRDELANLPKYAEDSPMTSQRYARASERFLAQARQELSAGDLAQASEKGWGATAQLLKAIAEQRGWEHHRRRHYHRIISRLRAETGDGDIRRLFDTASALHENFYENDTPADEVGERLDEVEALLGKLLLVLTTP